MYSSKRPVLSLAVLVGLVVYSSLSAAGRRVTDPQAPRALPESGPVQVQWTDPAQFSEIRHSRNRFEAVRGDWVRQLAVYVQERAGRRLPEGDTLAITVTDIERAGEFEPQQGIAFNSTRILRDVYPPRITLSFRWTDAQGQLKAEGERKLKDLLYLSNSRMGFSQDPLRYEKRLLDDWLRKEFADAQTAARESEPEVRTAG